MDAWRVFPCFSKFFAVCGYFFSTIKKCGGSACDVDDVGNVEESEGNPHASMRAAYIDLLKFAAFPFPPDSSNLICCRVSQPAELFNF